MTTTDFSVTSLLTDSNLYLITIQHPETGEKIGILAYLYKINHTVGISARSKRKSKTQSVQKFAYADIANYRTRISYTLSRIRLEIQAKNISIVFSAHVRARALQHADDIPALREALCLFGHESITPSDIISVSYDSYKAEAEVIQKLLDCISIS